MKYNVYFLTFIRYFVNIKDTIIVLRTMGSFIEDLNQLFNNSSTEVG